MSLTGTLSVGKTGLAVQQAALQVTGNNIANAGNADFTRQAASLAPGRDHQVRPGILLGTGVDLTSVKRQIDEALEGRLRGSISDNEAADSFQQWLGRVESVFNELGDDDLSTRLSTFFGSWSNLANKPQDLGLRQVVLQEGQTVANWFQDLRGQLGSLQKDVDARLSAQVQDADGLAKQIGDLNGQIVIAEGAGAGQANALRDRRDTLLKQLSQLMDVRTVPKATGATDVYVGSEPLVYGTESRGLALKEAVADGKTASYVVFKNDGGTVPLKNGQIGGLTQARTEIGGVVDQIDKLAGNLIFELNKLHAGGQGLDGFAGATATSAVADPTAALNTDAAGLAFKPVNGSFVVHVKHKATGQVTSTLVQVDLDGAGGETTLDSLRAELDGIADVSAAVNTGKLKVSADSDAVEISFSQDSSGVLAALGVNSFYTGQDARDIAVNTALKDKPTLLAAARNGEEGDNQTARLIAGLETQAVTALGGNSLKDRYQALINGVGSAAAGAKNEAEATRVVKETLEAQREALSGVSLDEEAINLMRQQRAFQGAARLVSAVDEMMQTILNMAG